MLRQRANVRRSDTLTEEGCSHIIAYEVFWNVAPERELEVVVTSYYHQLCPTTL
jgi:hypothetical protein